jgi:hypothetical protein
MHGIGTIKRRTILERIRQGQSQINKRMASNLECDSAEFSLIL